MMVQNVWFIAAVWMGLALIASLISIRTGISVALIEIVVGVIAGNLAVGLEGGTLQFTLASAPREAVDSITSCNQLNGRISSLC